MTLPQYTAKHVARFWSKVDRTGGPHACWLWLGVCNNNGYGMFSHGGRGAKPLLSHRVAYEITTGTIPPNTHVLHHCDVRNCVNPAHLWIGTHSDNMRDMSAKGRNGSQTHPESRPRGEQHGSRLHPERVARGDQSGSRLHPESRPRGEAHPRAKLTGADVAAIRDAHKNGQTQKVIAARYGVTQVLVSKIVRRKIWVHVA